MTKLLHKYSQTANYRQSSSTGTLHYMLVVALVWMAAMTVLLTKRKLKNAKVEWPLVAW